MNNYLVTGAAGFIGAAVARRLKESGNNVVTIDNLSTGFIENIPYGVEFIQGNCQDVNIINKLYNYSFDAIFHIAGQSSGEISFDDPVYDLQTNTQSTLLLLKYAREKGCKKFIYASSMSVYGDQSDEPISEIYPITPKSFYGVGKLASEHYMRIYSHYGIKCTSLRIFNVYGPGQNMNNLRQGMVSIFLAQAVMNKYINVKGSPDRFRDFIFIDDVVNSFMSALNKNDSDYDVFNVGAGVRITVKDLVQNIKDNLPFDIEVEYSGSTPGDQFGIYADITKIKRMLDWSPSIKLEDGLKMFIKILNL